MFAVANSLEVSAGIISSVKRPPDDIDWEVQPLRK
jgi:hypothetical protein